MLYDLGIGQEPVALHVDQLYLKFKIGQTTPLKRVKAYSLTYGGLKSIVFGDERTHSCNLAQRYFEHRSFWK